MIKYYLITIGVMSFISFLLFASDAGRSRSRRNLPRVPELTLMLFSALGGGAGALLAMLIFRHKTAKPSFITVVPLSTILQIGTAVALLL